jgi:hypothetical protein
VTPRRTSRSSRVRARCSDGGARHHRRGRLRGRRGEDASSDAGAAPKRVFSGSIEQPVCRLAQLAFVDEASCEPCRVGAPSPKVARSRSAAGLESWIYRGGHDLVAYVIYRRKRTIVIRGSIRHRGRSKSEEFRGENLGFLPGCGKPNPHDAIKGADSRGLPGPQGARPASPTPPPNRAGPRETIAISERCGRRRRSARP